MLLKWSSTALSRRIEIFVFPGSDLTTGPRFAREKSISRYFSAAPLLISLPLASIRLPRRDQPDAIRRPVCIDNHQQTPGVAQPQRHEPLLDRGVGILPCQSELVFQDRYRLGEADAVCARI